MVMLTIVQNLVLVSKTAQFKSYAAGLIALLNLLSVNAVSLNSKMKIK